MKHFGMLFLGGKSDILLVSFARGAWALPNCVGWGSLACLLPWRGALRVP